ncbi:MAG: MFS transporter [Actinobacteria bacterium]|nr:MFS transporter [Actinomycetota bacterium]
MTTAVPDRDSRYRRKLLFLLSSATFFEGYDNFVLSFVLALVLGDLGGSESQAGLIRAITSVGTVVAFLLAAQADRIGRKRLLLVTIVGYTASGLLTALSPNLVWLTAAQFLAQVFLGAEWAVAITIVVEDFPKEGRGRALGIVTSMNTLGGIFVGVLAFVGLQDLTPLSWRAFYVVGLVPLVLVGIGRRGMLETERYSAVRADPAAERLDHTSIWEPWKKPYRANVLGVGLMHFFRYAAVSAGAFWWAYYAQREVGMSVSLSGLYLAASGVLGAAGFIVAGRLIDRWGRRPTFVVYMAGAMVFGAWLFQIHSQLMMLPVLCATIFFGLGSSCITSAFATELFPTYVRSRAAAWCRNAFEIPGGIVGPLVVGILGDHVSGPIGSIGDAMSLTLVACIPAAIVLCLLHVPETRGADLVALDEVPA